MFERVTAVLHVTGERTLPLEATTARTHVLRLLTLVSVDHADMAATRVAVCEHFATDLTGIARLTVDSDRVDERKQDAREAILK